MADWTPDLLGAALKAWFKADAGTSTTTNGAAVSQWDDSSGNGLHASQATGSAQPIYRTNRLNGLPGIDFVSSDWLATNLSASSLDETFLAVVDVDSYATAPAILGPSGSGGRTFRFETTRTQHYIRSFVASIVTSTNAAPNVNIPFIVGGTLNNGFQQFNINGTTENKAVAATLAGSLTTHFGRDQGATVFDGDIFEIVVCTTLGTDDRQLVEGYLAWKWGVEASLPSGHPYESAAPTVADPDADVALAAGNLSLAGVAITVSAGSPVALTVGTMTLAGGSQTMGAGQAVALSAGNLALAGGTHAMTDQEFVSLTAGNLALGGNAVAMEQTQDVALTAGDLALAGNAVGETRSGSVALTVGAMALAGGTHQAVGASSVALTVGNLALAGGTQTIEQTQAVGLTVGDLALGGGTHAMTDQEFVSLTAGNLSLAGNAVGVGAGSAVGITTGDLALGGNGATLNEAIPPTEPYAQAYL